MNSSKHGGFFSFHDLRNEKVKSFYIAIHPKRIDYFRINQLSIKGFCHNKQPIKFYQYGEPEDLYGKIIEFYSYNENRAKTNLFINIIC